MNRLATIGIFLGICLLSTGAWADNGTDNAAPADTQPGVIDNVDQIAKSLGVPSLVLGGTYAQGTAKIYSGKLGLRAQLTDNGKPSPIIDFVTPEHVLYSFPMKYGKGVWGFNFVGTFGQTNMHYENTQQSGAITGTDIGTSVTGNYLAAAPFVYLRLGPVSPDTDTYWLFGYGLGVAMWHFSSDPIYYVNQGPGQVVATAETVAISSRPYWYQTWRWQFHYGNWDVRFEARNITPIGNDSNGNHASYENYGLGLGYTIHF